MTFILLIVGFALLLVGADAIVTGASTFARRIGISEMAVGLSVVSIGTSLPELVVNVMASVQGNAGLAIGNVLGSNIANGLLILGVAAVIRPLPITERTLLSEIPFTLAAALLVGFLANAALFSVPGPLTISRIDGAILIFFFLLFLSYLFGVARDTLSATSESGPTLPALARMGGGCLALAIGGKWVVDSALDLGGQFGMSESFVGITVVAIGTSVPELMTSAVAAYRGKSDLAIGNVVGSSIFNLLWVLGVSALINPIPFDVLSNSDLAMVIASSTLLIGAVVLGSPRAIARWEGGCLLVTYCAYLAFVVKRG
jgi:cation:H+ antiporter